MGWVVGDSLKSVLLSEVVGTRVESVNSLWHVLVLLNKSVNLLMLSGSLLCLLKASGG